jgi:hypothetical protein
MSRRRGCHRERSATLPSAEDQFARFRGLCEGFVVALILIGLGVCREYVSTSLTFRLSSAKIESGKPALRHLLPPYARKAVFCSPCMAFPS